MVYILLFLAIDLLIKCPALAIAYLVYVATLAVRCRRVFILAIPALPKPLMCPAVLHPFLKALQFQFWQSSALVNNQCSFSQ